MVMDMTGKQGREERESEVLVNLEWHIWIRCGTKDGNRKLEGWAVLSRSCEGI